jgi:hypothetical protein
MSATNNISGDAFSRLAAQLFKTVDGNNDGQLTKTEFQSFLTKLVGQIAGDTLGDDEAPAGTPAESTQVVYRSMLGFDYTKLNTPSHTTPKYVFARATQDLDFAWDRPSRSEGLARIAEYAKSHGYPNTTVVGDDKLNFGDGHGNIDVLTGDGQWWWGPPEA